MFRTLLVPLDGSDLAERALPYAVRLAKADKGQLVLMRAALAPVPDRLDGANWEEDQLDAIGEAQQYLAAVATKVATQVPVATSVTYGRAAPEILNQVSVNAADAVVMATHGRTGLSHLLIGSVAETLLAQSAVPLFLVHARPGSEPTPPFDPVAARLVVPLDGSAFAEAALQPAIRFLGPAGELVLVCITRPPDHVVMDASRHHVVAYIDQQEEASSREAHDYLDRVAMKLRAEYPGMHVSTHSRIADDAATGIVDAAGERAADLVVMATHGRTGVRRAVVGSVAGEVLRTGLTPLLLVGPSVRVASAPVDEVLHETARH
jgi:nucleotide-binding universal stress UspA family protein